MMSGSRLAKGGRPLAQSITENKIENKKRSRGERDLGSEEVIDLGSEKVIRDAISNVRIKNEITRGME